MTGLIFLLLVSTWAAVGVRTSLKRARLATRLADCANVAAAKLCETTSGLAEALGDIKEATREVQQAGLLMRHQREKTSQLDDDLAGLVRAGRLTQLGSTRVYACHEITRFVVSDLADPFDHDVAAKLLSNSKYGRGGIEEVLAMEKQASSAPRDPVDDEFFMPRHLSYHAG